MSKSNSPFFFPFVFWVSLSITVLFRQYIWVLYIQTSYNVSNIRVNVRPLFPLPGNRSDRNISVHNIPISFSDHNQNNPEITDLSRLTQISLIGTLERGSPTKFFPNFILRDAQIVSYSTLPVEAQKLSYPLYNRLRSIADSFVFSLSSALPSIEADLAAGVLLGGNQRFSYQFRENIRQSGLSHLTAVSGYNITVLIGSAMVLGKLLRKRYLIIPGVMISIIFFTLITGGSASVIRAAMMGTVGFLALQAGSLRSTQRIFVLTALFMLLIQPAWLWDVGWELSTAATASLIWLQPVIYKLLCHSETRRGSWESVSAADCHGAATAPQNDDRNRKKNPFLESFSASFSAYLATFPILVWRFGWNNISWVGILTNIPAAFLVPWIMAVGAVIGFTGLIWPAGAQILAVLTRPPIWALVKIIEWGSKINEFHLF